jgi:DNA-damage-inducible protein J
VAADKRLPFEPLAPNAQTVAAIRQARRGGLPRFADAGALLDYLDADD